MLVCAHQKGYVNVSTCQKMFCLQRRQLCPWCRCTFDFLAGPEVKSSKIKYGTLCHKSWCAREHERYHPPHLNPNLTPRMIRVQCWCVQGNMNTHPAPPPQPQPQPVIGLACADVCLRRASMSHSWRAQMRALGVCRWVVCPRSQS